MTQIYRSEDIVFIRIENKDITWSDVFMQNWMSNVLKLNLAVLLLTADIMWSSEWQTYKVQKPFTLYASIAHVVFAIFFNRWMLIFLHLEKAICHLHTHYCFFHYFFARFSFQCVRLQFPLKLNAKKLRKENLASFVRLRMDISKMKSMNMIS